jgi:hypothetical protein
MIPNMMNLFSDPLMLASMSSSNFSEAVPIVAIIFGCIFLIIKTITKAVVETNARKYDRAQAAGKNPGGPSDVSAIRQMQQTLTKMEERVEALETILIEHTRSQKL